LSCHNYWIVLRLVGGGEPPFMAFSPQITMEDTSVPFRAFLGAILSVAKRGVVEARAFSDSQILDTIDEEEDEEGYPSTSDADNGSGE